MDLFSRKIVGWEVHSSDTADHAAHLVRRTALTEGIYGARDKPVLHGDNGSTLKATTVLAMLNWLGIERIDRFVSMSDMKHDALVGQGIRIVERVPIPDDLVPEDARVEMEAKKAAGYFSHEQPANRAGLAATKGRALGDY